MVLSTMGAGHSRLASGKIYLPPMLQGSKLMDNRRGCTTRACQRRDVGLTGSKDLGCRGSRGSSISLGPNLGDSFS